MAAFYGQPMLCNSLSTGGRKMKKRPTNHSARRPLDMGNYTTQCFVYDALQQAALPCATSLLIAAVLVWWLP